MKNNCISLPKASLGHKSDSKIGMQRTCLRHKYEDRRPYLLRVLMGLQSPGGQGPQESWKL